MQNFLTKKAVTFIAIIFAIITFTCTMPSNHSNAKADTLNNEIYYGDDFYSEQGTSWSEIETIDYATKEITYYRINRNYPEYFNTDAALTNACANVAGSNVIGFYDKYYDNLIPNCTVGRTVGRFYLYYDMWDNSAIIQSLIGDLYVRMGTNNPDAGTSQSQYKQGLSSYINSKNLSTTYSSVMTNSTFDLSKAITQLNAGNPISLFMSGYNFTCLSDNGDVATLFKNIYTGNHIAIAYGYQKHDYYNSDGSLMKSNVYLYVATGYTADSDLYIVNNNGTLNDAEAIHVS